MLHLFSFHGIDLKKVGFMLLDKTRFSTQTVSTVGSIF